MGGRDRRVQKLEIRGKKGTPKEVKRRERREDGWGRDGFLEQLYRKKSQYLELGTGLRNNYVSPNQSAYALLEGTINCGKYQSLLFIFLCQEV